ncbi:MAG TPA: hypothetical protein VN113_06860 [Caulobacter sp.]|nr:hypothetical protein [Caulobacter sp.]
MAFTLSLLTRETGEGDREAVEGALPSHSIASGFAPPPSRRCASRHLPRERGRRTL